MCIFLTTRGNYAKMRSTIKSIQDDSRFKLTVVLGGSLTLPESSDLQEVIKQDGIKTDEHVHFVVKGETPDAIAASAGLCTLSMAQIYERHKPDIAVIIADRFESLSAAHAALCQNIHIAHLEGGEVSGSIDERIRHAITKLSHIHLVSNEDSKMRVIKMGENSEHVHIVGNPSLDQIFDVDLNNTESANEYLHRCCKGNVPDLQKKFLLVSQHPVATEFDGTSHQIDQTILAIKKTELPAIWVLPNIDSGSEIIRHQLKLHLPDHKNQSICTISNLPFSIYAVLMANTCCLVGNSSSGVREGSFLGTPVVNIGRRQQFRTRGENILDVENDANAILEAIYSQIQHGRFLPSELYGYGKSGIKIASILKSNLPPIDKTIAY